MKILVIARAVAAPNPTSAIATDKISINPYDERAVEAAAKLKKQLPDAATVAVLAIGNNTDTILRNCLARGADTAFKVNCPHLDDDLALARIIAFFIKQQQLEQPDLILLGQQSTDTDTTFLAPMLAQLLGYAVISNVNEISYDHKISFTLPQGDIVEYGVPLVASVSYTINNPSFLKLPDLIAAKKKPLHSLELSNEHYPQLADSLLVTDKLESPDHHRNCKFINYDELLALLKVAAQPGELS